MPRMALVRAEGRYLGPSRARAGVVGLWRLSRTGRAYGAGVEVVGGACMPF